MNLFEGFGQVFHISWLVFTHGGWAVVVLVMLWILYKLYLNEISGQFLRSQEWTFLSIRVPRENLTSTLAVESIFGQMHALLSSITFAQQYIEGKMNLWYSLEIVSMGGKISFIIRTPAKQRDLVEAAFYAQYPNAEISEVADYLSNLDYDPETSDLDIWGCEYGLIADQVIPIRTYRDFEHPSAEEKIIDPLASLFEALGKMAPYEFYGVQIIIMPLGDPEWKPAGELKVKELTGQEVPKEKKLSDIFMAPLNAVADFSFKKAVLGGNGAKLAETKPKSNWQFMTEAEKLRVTLIEQKIGKPGYKTKMRHLYIAPKDKFDSSKKAVVIGAFRPLGSAMTNGFKPDTKKTWTGLEYMISPSLEKPYIDYVVKERKRKIFKAYKERDWWVGNPMFILNTEELATLYHFPITTVPTVAPVEKTESKKASPPVNLPIGEI